MSHDVLQVAIQCVPTLPPFPRPVSVAARPCWLGAGGSGLHCVLCDCAANVARPRRKLFVLLCPQSERRAYLWVVHALVRGGWGWGGEENKWINE